MQEIPTTEPQKRNWLYVISPCILASAFSVIAIFYSYMKMESSGGWSFLGVIVYAPILLLLVGIDFVAKLLVKHNVFFVWIIEIFVLVVIALLLKHYVMS